MIRSVMSKCMMTTPRGSVFDTGVATNLNQRGSRATMRRYSRANIGESPASTARRPALTAGASSANMPSGSSTLSK